MRGLHPQAPCLSSWELAPRSPPCPLGSSEPRGSRATPTPLQVIPPSAQVWGPVAPGPSSQCVLPASLSQLDPSSPLTARRPECATQGGRSEWTGGSDGTPGPGSVLWTLEQKHPCRGSHSGDAARPKGPSGPWATAVFVGSCAGRLWRKQGPARGIPHPGICLVSSSQCCPRPPTPTLATLLLPPVHPRPPASSSGPGGTHRDHGGGRAQVLGATCRLPRAKRLAWARGHPAALTVLCVCVRV